MTVLQILFILVACITLGSAVMVVIVKNLIHAALWLILTLFGVAIFFVLLNANFLAMAQVIIYIGAISILMIFAIMLTRKTGIDFGSQINSNWWTAALITTLLFFGIVWMLRNWGGIRTPLPRLDVSIDPLKQLGGALVSPNAYLIPFEVASVLLLAALIGAIYVAWERK